MTIAERFLDHAGEVFARRRGGRYLSHEHSEPRDENDPERAAAAGRAGGGALSQTVRTKLGPVCQTKHANGLNLQ
jgi:hypothetical protein